MRLENYTNISESNIRKIVTFVKPNNLPTSKFDVKITNSRYGSCGVFYQYGGYSKRANAMGSQGRPLIIVRISRNDNEFPYWSDHRPTKVVTFHYNKYNIKKNKWESWRISKHIGTKNGNSGGYIDSIILSREEALVHNLGT